MSIQTDERYEILKKAMRKINYDGDSLIEILHIAQEIFGYLETKTLKFVATYLKLPYSKVYGVATFYHFFRHKPRGKHNVVVCEGTACHIKCSGKILNRIEEKYNIKAEQTTKNGLLSILTVRCVGSCSLAPILIFDNKLISNLSPKQSLNILKKILK